MFLQQNNFPEQDEQQHKIEQYTPSEHIYTHEIKNKV